MEEFYRKLKKLMPLKYEKGDFRDVLSDNLDKYMLLVKEYKEILGPNINKTIRCIERHNNHMKKCVNFYFEGQYHEAYKYIHRILSSKFYKNEYPDILPKTVFYRARKEIESENPLERIFHIPFDKRGKVKTERYSAPGYPCLYLGASINVCWEELGQPILEDMKISRFVVTEKFPVLDLRIPRKNDLEGDKKDTILKKLPLIIASSISVYDQEAFFKPEYIIPQLIIEYIITQNRYKYKHTQFSLFDFVLGVYYTSTHINDKMKFPASTFDNLALPAVLVEKNRTYCYLIASCFEWTKPTSYTYENSRCEFTSNVQSLDKYLTSAEKEKNYKFSKMEKLEKRLSLCKTNKLYYLVMGKKIINIPAEGGRVEVEIRASDEYIIK